MLGYANHFEVFHGNQKTISKEEKAVLDLIWTEFLKTGESIPEQILFEKFPVLGKPHSEGNPWTRLQNRLPPHLFEKRQWQGYKGIGPTFIGVLFSSRGQELEKLLVQYLEWLQQVAKGIQAPDTVTVKQVMKALSLNEAQAFELCQLVIKGGFAPIPLERQKPKSWRLFLPYDIKDILQVQDLEAFVVDRALGRTNPPWSPSFQRKFKRLDSVARQRLRIRGIGDESSMEEPFKAVQPKAQPNTQKPLSKVADSPNRGSRRKALPAISSQDLKSIRALADEVNAKELARVFGISPRALYDLMEGKAGALVRRKVAKADRRFAHFADFA